MNNARKLLKKYIKCIVEAASNPLFKVRNLKELKTIEDVKRYAAVHLDELGEGSSRIVYRISPRKVLKVAKDPRGLAQNEAELDIYTSPKSKPIVTKVHDYDPQHKWIISEIVRPMMKGEFYYYFGVRFLWFANHFDGVFEGIRKGKIDPQDNETIKKKLPSEIEADPEYWNFFRAILDTALEGNLLPGDITIEPHWGVAGDGRVVLYDYGFTESVRERHYTLS